MTNVVSLDWVGIGRPRTSKICAQAWPTSWSPGSPEEGSAWGGSLVRRSPQPSPPISPLGVSAAPSPGEEEGSTPTAGPEVEDWIVTEVRPGVAAVPVGEETTAIPGFTVEPENKTEWELAYTPAGTFPLPGPSGLSCTSCCLPEPGCGLDGAGEGVLSLGPVP